MGTDGNYSSYYQNQSSGYSASAPTIPSILLAYANANATDYDEGDTRSQTPGLPGSYNADIIMYNVPHAATQQSVYDTPQYTARQHAAMQILPSDVVSNYFTSEAAGDAATALQASGQSSSTPTNAYQAQNPGLSYFSSMSDVNDGHHQQSTSSRAGPAEAREYGEEDAAAERWATFESQLRTVFQDVSSGQLERASATLCSITSWMLSHVVELGLHQDNSALHEDRLRRWADLNNAWLALAFQQKELMSSGQQESGSQSLMSEDTVKKMGDELIRLCDGIERHGLVDYEYGVWEEQIEAVLEECLDLFDQRDGPA